MGIVTSPPFRFTWSKYLQELSSGSDRRGPWEPYAGRIFLKVLFHLLRCLEWTTRFILTLAYFYMFPVGLGLDNMIFGSCWTILSFSTPTQCLWRGSVSSTLLFLIAILMLYKIATVLSMLFFSILHL